MACITATPTRGVRGEMFAHDPAMTEAAVRAVVEVDLGARPMFAKLSPNVTDLVAIAAAALRGGATGLTLVNTVRGLLVDAEARRPTLGAGASGGGLSGAAIKPIALRAVFDVAASPPGVPIIGTGGVIDGRRRGRDAARRRVRGRRRDRDVPRPARDAADPRRARRLVSRARRRRVADLTGTLRAMRHAIPTRTSDPEEQA